MDNYTLLSVADSLRIATSKKSGIVLHEVRTITKEYKKRQSKTQGMRLMKTHELFSLLPSIVRSSTDMSIVSYIVTFNTKRGEVKKPNGKGVTSISDLAIHFNVTRKKVSEVIARLLETNILKKNKRILIVNPYLVAPYGINNNTLFILQTYWDSNFTYDITEELIEAEKAYLLSKD